MGTVVKVLSEDAALRTIGSPERQLHRGAASSDSDCTWYACIQFIMGACHRLTDNQGYPAVHMLGY
jgi:hypothetical protein